MSSSVPLNYDHSVRILKSLVKQCKGDLSPYVKMLVVAVKQVLEIEGMKEGKGAWVQASGYNQCREDFTNDFTRALVPKIKAAGLKVAE